MLSNAYVYLLTVGFMFIPFMKALTVDVGFPLKIYEIVFSGAIALFLLSARRVDRVILMRFAMPLLFFLLAALASYFRARYESNDFQDIASRGGAAADGAFRIVYATFNILVMIIVAQAVQKRGKMLYIGWQAGMVMSAVYAIYCAFALTRGVDVFTLPGIERHQLGEIGPLTVSRSGTFEEGNFAGYYFLASAVLAWYWRHRALLCLALLALFLTKSAATYFALLICVGVMGYMATKSRLQRAFIIFSLSIAAAGTLAFFESEDKFSYRAGSSGGVRLNEAMTGIEMFKAQPMLGFSLGGYGYAYYRYQWTPELSVENAAERRIPGVVYIEILAETGLVGFFFFFLFWWRWFQQMRAWRGRGRIFCAFAIAMMVGWLAFPTFAITYVWTFAGVALGMAIAQARHSSFPKSDGRLSLPKRRSRPLRSARSPAL